MAILPERDFKQFETGAQRSKNADGTRYDLISPIALERLAKVYKEGADKYGDFNWEKGMPVSDLLNHAIRHMYAYLSGDRTEDHLGHSAWNAMAAIHSAEKWPKLNDNLRPEYTLQKHTFGPIPITMEEQKKAILDAFNKKEAQKPETIIHD